MRIVLRVIAGLLALVAVVLAICNIATADWSAAYVPGHNVLVQSTFIPVLMIAAAWWLFERSNRPT